MYEAPESWTNKLHDLPGLHWKRTYERSARETPERQAGYSPPGEYSRFERSANKAPPLQYEASSVDYEQASRTPLLSPKAIAAEALTAGAALAGAIALRMQYKHREEERLAQQASLRHPLRGTTSPQKGALLAAGAGLLGALALKERHNLAHYLHLGGDPSHDHLAWQEPQQEERKTKAGEGFLNDLRRAFSPDRPVWQMSQEEKENAREGEGFLHDLRHVFFPQA